MQDSQNIFRRVIVSGSRGAFTGGAIVTTWSVPHQAIGLQPPISRYQPSNRLFPESLPPIEYSPDDHVRKVQHKGEFSFQGRTWKVSKAFFTVILWVCVLVLKTAVLMSIFANIRLR